MQIIKLNILIHNPKNTYDVVPTIFLYYFDLLIERPSNQTYENKSQQNFPFMSGICNQLSIHFMKLLFMGFFVAVNSVSDQSVMIEYNKNINAGLCIKMN